VDFRDGLDSGEQSLLQFGIQTQDCPSHTIVTIPTALSRDLRLPPAQKVTRKCISWFCGKLRATVFREL
jgi:hypothetical protein